MKFYMTIRFGHAESPDGPDGDNTVFLVRARDYAEAAALTDSALRALPVSSPKSQRPVRPFCNRVLELGEDCASGKSPGIMGGPWIGGDYHLDCPAYSMWCRGDVIDEWQDARVVFVEIYGSQPRAL